MTLAQILAAAKAEKSGLRVPIDLFKEGTDVARIVAAGFTQSEDKLSLELDADGVAALTSDLENVLLAAEDPDNETEVAATLTTPAASTTVATVVETPAATSTAVASVALADTDLTLQLAQERQRADEATALITRLVTQNRTRELHHVVQAAKSRGVDAKILNLGTAILNKLAERYEPQALLTLDVSGVQQPSDTFQCVLALLDAVPGIVPTAASAVSDAGVTTAEAAETAKQAYILAEAKRIINAP